MTTKNMTQWENRLSDQFQTWLEAEGLSDSESKYWAGDMAYRVVNEFAIAIETGATLEFVDRNDENADMSVFASSCVTDFLSVGVRLPEFQGEFSVGYIEGTGRLLVSNTAV